MSRFSTRKSRIDVPVDLPGMGMFDHAIVYVPGKNPIWIDATDRYAQLGQMPMGDQGRLSLITSEATTALIEDSGGLFKDNGVVETREFTLTDNGPANVVEITEPTGIWNRTIAAFTPTSRTTTRAKALRGYIKSEYLCDDLSKVDRTDPADLSQPFKLTIACEKAKRGYTELENAQAAIRVDRLFQFLPEELKRKDDSDEKKTTDTDKPKKPRTDDWWLNAPYNMSGTIASFRLRDLFPRSCPRTRPSRSARRN